MAGHDDQQFRCEVQVRRAAVRIGPVGELDIATVPIIEDQLALCAAAGLKQLTFDLRSLSFLDATGLRLILLWNTKSRTGSFTFSVIAGSPAVQRLFNLTDSRKQIDFVDMSPCATRLRLGTARFRDSCTTGRRGARAAQDSPPSPRPAWARGARR